VMPGFCLHICIVDRVSAQLPSLCALAEYRRTWVRACPKLCVPFHSYMLCSGLEPA
jgi:hypothetical protein